MSLIDTSTLRALGSKPVLLDVRTSAEFAAGHIPGAVNLPLDLLREHRGRLGAAPDQEIVLVCRSGARAVQAAQVLAEAGLRRARVLDGGMNAWEAAGAPVNRGTPRWQLERQVRLVAGGIVLISGVGGLLLPGAHWLGTAIGAGLVIAAVTDSCLMGTLLSKLPYNRGPKVDPRAAIARLARQRP